MSLGIQPSSQNDPSFFARGPLERIVKMEELHRRLGRSPNYRGENDALRLLAKLLSDSPQAALQGLADQALKLCRAESAGIGITEICDGKNVFRWHAVSGNSPPHPESATPPGFGSACGSAWAYEAQATGASHSILRERKAAPGEALLVPFFRGAQEAGALWVAHHNANKRFDREDQRIMESLAAFASGVAQSYLREEAADLARRRQEEVVSLLESEKELREKFVTALTHDLRTPLTSAKMSAQLLARKAGEPEAVLRSAARISASVDRAERMVRDLLDANRLKAGEGIPLSIEACRLDEVVNHSVKELTALNGERFEFVNEAHETEGYWDHEALSRVIDNLASNAVKYGAPGKTITIGLVKQQHYAEISVHNEGDAISIDDQKSLFKSYRRTDSAVSSGQKGWGIGLVLVKGIAEAHGGSVRLESFPERGTTVYVRVPLDCRLPS